MAASIHASFQKIFATLLLSLCCSIVSGSPVAGPSTQNNSLGKICVVPSKYTSSGGLADDSPAIATALADCSTNATVIFTPGVNYNVFTPISATNLSNVVIAVQGNLHLPTNITTVSAIVAKTSTWFTIKGSNIDWIGTKDVNNGWIYSYGQAWWDSNPPGGTGVAGRPHLMSFNAQTATIQHFKSMKPIAWNVNLQGSNIVVTDTIIDAYSTNGFPFNTDGFDVGGTNITIRNSVIYNGDDAIAVGSGASNVLFQGATIGYQTHGMSIGSLGSNQAAVASVSNIRFDDVTVINGVYAARFKSWQGGQGLARNVTWSNIRVYNVTFPIFVTQSYSNQATSSAATSRPNNSSVIMENFTWANFTGTINQFSPGDGSCVSNPCWYDLGLPNLTHTEAVVIECNTDSSCRNFALSNIEVFPQAGVLPPTAICINCTAANNPNLGFGGQNGTFNPTY